MQDTTTAPDAHNAPKVTLSSSRWHSTLAWSLFFLITLGLDVLGLKSLAVKDKGFMHDFVVPYSGAQCLRTGCDPYNIEQVKHAFAVAGGDSKDVADSWALIPPVYPPSTLVELFPFSLLHYHLARLIWFLLSASAFITAIILTATFVSPPYRGWIAVLGILLRCSHAATFGSQAGQASTIAVGLIVIALWCFLEDRFIYAGIFCLGVSMGLKPQLAGLVFFYFVLRSVSRRFALWSGGVAILFLAAGILWLGSTPASQNWRRELSSQVISSQHFGAVNDPSLLNRGSADLVNAQSVGALVWEDPHSYNLFAYCMAGTLILLFAVRAAAPDASRIQLFNALAAIACIGMLPVYHRAYDLLILVLTFPSLVHMLAKPNRLRWLTLGATIGALIPSAIFKLLAIIYKTPTFSSFVQSDPIRALIVLRVQSLAVIALSALYLISMYTAEKRVPMASG